MAMAYRPNRWQRRLYGALACGGLTTFLVFETGAGGALAQPSPRIWNVQLGAPVSELPRRDFVDPACGSNGGPPGLILKDFAEFGQCAREGATGLREIRFGYEDEAEYIARATRSEALITRNLANQVLGHPVVFSLLVDDAGLVQGYRVITDNRADTLVRFEAASLAVHFKIRFGPDDWACTDLPAAEGETPIGREFIKERCEKSVDGLSYNVESRYYFKPGQGLFDPHTRKPTVGEGEFESWARLEAIQLDAARP